MAGARRKQSAARIQKVHVQRESQVTRENVFLFVPNLIGYTRVILAAISLYYMRGNPRVCTVLYCVSCILDAFDGKLARMLQQSTRFGAVLDMVTDRCTTACLLCYLTAAYPNFALIFQGLVTLDFSSHYIHMYSSLVSGSTSHKKVDSKTSRILALYYTNTRVLFVLCAANELFFLCLYLMAFYTRPLGLNIASLFPSALFDWVTADKMSWQFKLVYETIPSLTWPQIVGAISFPMCAVKQVINGVQFWKAAKVLADMDVQDRSRRRM